LPGETITSNKLGMHFKYQLYKMSILKVKKLDIIFVHYNWIASIEKENCLITSFIFVFNEICTFLFVVGYLFFINGFPQNLELNKF